MDVSIIIINYNTKDITSECIKSVSKYTKNISYEIILVDNSSTDGSREYFSQYQGIKYVYNDTNYGFGVANNIGSKYASGEYLFFLNSDTILHEDSVSILRKYLINNSKAAAVGPILVGRDGKDNGSYYPFRKHSIIKRTFQRIRKKKVKNNEGYICGAAIMMRKSVFDQLNGFDPSFFMYYEEMDLQMRVYNIGYTCDNTDETSIIHLRGASTSLSYKKYCMRQKSLYLFGVKHFHGAEYFQFHLANIIGTILSIILHNKDFSLKQKMDALMNAFKSYGIKNAD